VRRWTLRRTLPAGIALLVALAALVSLVYAFVSGERELREQGRLDMLQTAQRLARMAQRELQNNRHVIAVELAHSATDRRVRALAIVGEDGRVELAHRGAWQGRPAWEVLAEFSKDRFRRATGQGLPDVRTTRGGWSLSVLTPFAMPADRATPGGKSYGAVYVEYDLSPWAAALGVRLLTAHAPTLGALLLMLLLPLALHRLVVRPLSAVEEASRRLAATPNAAPPPLPTVGPEEVTSLAASFNKMSHAIQAAQRERDVSEAHLRSTFELAAVGIAHLSTEGKFLRVNRRLCEILGYGEEELKSLRFQDLTHPEDRASDALALQRLLAGDVERHSVERRYSHAGGTEIWVSLSLALVRATQYTPAYYIAVVEDVTERRQAAALTLSAKASERASAAKSEFLSRMSHELRTPLNAVLGFAQLLRMDSARPLPPQQQKMVKHIEAAGEHLLSMIGDVLDLSRIESGRISINCRPVVIADMARDSMALVEVSADDQQVRLESDGPAADQPGGQVLADELRLRQVLVNLLSNAVKYNRRHGCVSLSWRAVGEARVRMEVRDTGKGMSPDQLSRLFQPFNRLGAEHSGIEGTGIGLVVTRRLIELMDGEIHVHSEIDQGTTVQVLLPVARSGVVRISEPAFADRPTAASAPGPTSVLYAEDNPTNALLVSELLATQAGYRIEVASSGEEALQAAMARPPDVMLIDMQLGAMSGIELRRRLAQDPRFADMPCIAVSADAMPESVAAAERAGFRAYLTKPLDLQMVLSTLTRVLGR
jgi:PAS domain S-box-containing protein